jgi:thiosulfate/3-mercaptopyruvate sulfurtransferase
MTGGLPDSLVTAKWLADRLNDDQIRVVDIRGYVRTEELGGGRQSASYSSARDEYLEAHVPGSVFVDWTKDITDPDAEVKAQIAPPALFKRQMEAIGVGDETSVVIVDHTGGHMATRLWWALAYYGKDDVAVLDGGFNRWSELGLPLTSEASLVPQVTFTPRECPWLRATAEDVHAQSAARTGQIVDARDPDTYAGSTQRGRRGGHVPGALSLPAQALVRRDGQWRSREEIHAAATDAGVSMHEPVTAYCNGGVTATALLFGLHRAGVPLTSLTNYDGSWNEWGERADLPVEGNRDLFND